MEEKKLVYYQTPNGQITDTSAQGTDDSDTRTSEEDTEFNAGSDSIFDRSCFRYKFNVYFIPAKLMILLDRSGSMSTTEWKQATKAITNLLLVWKEIPDVNFGFDVFPRKNDCATDQPVVFDCEASIHDEIIEYVDNIKPENYSILDSENTPLCKAMNNFTKPTHAPKFSTWEATRYLLVVSDGEDTCDAPKPCGQGSGIFRLPDFEKLTTNLLDMGIRTFAIGFGPTIAMIGANRLDEIAKNGGTAQKNYIHATNQNALQDALEDIASSMVVSCVYDVDNPEATADPGKINFYFDDDEIVGQDDDCKRNKGWTWVNDSHNRVEFCKEACDSLRNREVENISAVFGCRTETVVK